MEGLAFMVAARRGDAARTATAARASSVDRFFMEGD
jgi:hypothetical protein